MNERDVIALIADALGVETDRLSRESTAGDFEQWDSMGLLAIITQLDRQGIRFDPGQAAKLQTMQGLLDAFREAGKLEP